MNIALISYNCFADKKRNGWHGICKKGRILLLQGEASRTPQMGRIVADRHTLYAVLRKLFVRLEQHIEKVNKIIFYLGEHGGPQTISFVKTHNIPAEKVVFLFCKHTESSEHQKSCGATEICVSCGGNNEMELIFRTFLEHGRLVLPAPKLPP